MWNKFFNPKSVALIGASNRPGSVGLAMAKNLLSSRNRRKIFFVNPFKKKILGQKAYPCITAVPQKIDLAVIAVPAPAVLKAVKECSQKKAGAVVVISAGFAEEGKEGKKRQEAVWQILAKNNIPLLGPNCLGIIRPSAGLNASFAPIMPMSGDIAFISQSGALIDSLIDISLKRQFGFSGLVSLGNGAGLGISRFLNFFAEDKETRVIAMYIEGLKAEEGEKFIKAACKASRLKYLIALKGGQTNEGNRAVCSHTGVLAGQAEIYSSAFKKAGIIEVQTITELTEISLALSLSPAAAGRNIGVITNGGAAGVLISDWLNRLGLKVKAYQDLLGDASSRDYAAALKSVLGRQDINGVIVCQTFQAMTEPEKNASITVAAQRKCKSKPVLSLLIGGMEADKAREVLRKQKLPYFNEPRQIARAMAALVWAGNLLK